LASLGGWIAVALIVLAATLPLAHRARVGKRATPDSRTISIHFALGSAAAAFAFVHTLLALSSLGSSQAVGGGAAALLPGGAAVFVLMAHAGIGLQLRDPKLRDRAKKRRVHVATAITIAVTVAAHVIALTRAK
jgi:hypothetical protein